MSTTMSTYLPAPMEVRELLEGLLGREVSVNTAPPLVHPASVAIYVTDSLQVAAVSCADVALSAYIGAALGLVPVTSANEAISARVLDEGLRENLYEVLNIAASLFNAPGAEHVRLYKLHPVGQQLPPDAAARALTLGRRLDLSVEIAGYGSGRLSFVMMTV
jgi:hypothetical protein